VLSKPKYKKEYGINFTYTSRRYWYLCNQPTILNTFFLVWNRKYIDAHIIICLVIAYIYFLKQNLLLIIYCLWTAKINQSLLSLTSRWYLYWVFKQQEILNGERETKYIILLSSFNNLLRENRFVCGIMGFHRNCFTFQVCVHVVTQNRFIKVGYKTPFVLENGRIHTSLGRGAKVDKQCHLIWAIRWKLQATI